MDGAFSLWYVALTQLDGPKDLPSRMEEMVRAGQLVGGSDFVRMAKILDDGLWNESLFDPST